MNELQNQTSGQMMIEDIETEKYLSAEQHQNFENRLAIIEDGIRKTIEWMRRQNDG